MQVWNCDHAGVDPNYSYTVGYGPEGSSEQASLDPVKPALQLPALRRVPPLITGSTCALSPGGRCGTCRRLRQRSGGRTEGDGR